jgi:hypothetical protein
MLFCFFLWHNMDDNQHDNEMIGLHHPANGRSCVQHDCCRRYLMVGELVRFRREVIQVDYGPHGDPEPDYWYEMVMTVIIVRDGVKSCHVGFLPCHDVARAQEVNHLHGKFAQVLELYDNDEVGCVRKNKSICNHGMASYHLLDDVLEA